MTPQCFKAAVSTQMVFLLFCQMITRSHMLPINQHELDFLLDPVAQAENESLESKVVVAKSIFNTPLKTVAPTRCPPGTQSIHEGGPCVPRASSISVDYDILCTLIQLTKKGASPFLNNRKKGGSGHRVRNRGGTTTVSPAICASSTTTATTSRPTMPLVHTRDSEEKQPASPSTAYVLQSPQEAFPLPPSHQTTSVNSEQQTPINVPANDVNFVPVIAATTSEAMTVPEEYRDQSTHTVPSSAEVFSETTAFGALGNSVPEITESLTASVLSSSTLASSDPVTDKPNDMEASSTMYVPSQFYVTSDHSHGHPHGSIGKGAPVTPTVNNLADSMNATTTRPDTSTGAEFHFSSTNANREQFKPTVLAEENKDEHMTEKVSLIQEEIKSTIEPPTVVAAEPFDSFSSEMRFQSGLPMESNRNTRRRVPETEPYFGSMSTSSQKSPSFATTDSQFIQQEKEINVPSSVARIVGENRFSTTRGAPGITHITQAQTEKVPEQRQSVVGAPRDTTDETSFTLASSGEKWLQPEVEVDFDLDTGSEDSSVFGSPQSKNSFPQRFIIPLQPTTVPPLLQSEVSKSILDSTRQQNNRRRNSVKDSSTPITLPIARQRSNHQNQFYIYDYLTFDHDRPRPFA